MWLRQATASQEILLGYFVDATDGDTEETALSIANTDIKLWFEGATTLANKNSGGATHISNGLYSAVLDATDTATLGKLEVCVHVAGARTVRREYMVLPTDVFDAMVLGTDRLNVKANIIDTGTAQSATGSTIVLRSAAAFANSELIGATVTIRSATAGAGQSRVINSYTGSTDTAGVDTWSTTPTGTIVYDIIGTAPPSTGSPNSVNVTRWNGTAVSTPATAGIPEVNVKNINNVAAATPGAAGGLFIAGTNAATTVTTSFTTTFTGNLTGSVASVTGAVGSVATGGIVAASFAAGAIDAAAIATDALGALELAAGAASEIAAAVFDLATAGHTTSGTFGAAVVAAGGAGDPWSTSLPGAYGAGTAGFIIGTNIDALISSRLSTVGYTAPLTAAGVRTAVGLASANLDTQLSAIAGYIDTEVGTIVTAVGNIQTRLPAALTGAGMMKVDVLYVHNVLLRGTGVLGDEWGP